MYPVMLPFAYYPVSRYRRSVGKNAPQCLHRARAAVPNNRDAWIKADQTEYDGAHACTL